MTSASTRQHDAVELVKAVSYSTFDGTVEPYMHTTLDPRRADQAISCAVRLPDLGLGKSVRVLVFAAGEAARAAQEAGADYIISATMRASRRSSAAGPTLTSPSPSRI